MWWVISAAVFWIPPFFAISWLADAKEPDGDNRRPLGWGLLGWLGALLYAARKTVSQADATAARSRSRVVAFVSLIGLCAAVGLFLWERENAPIDMRATVASMRGASVSSCSVVGWMAIAGQREDVHRCYLASGDVAGCFYEDSRYVYDVTAEARSLREVGGVDLGC